MYEIHTQTTTRRRLGGHDGATLIEILMAVAMLAVLGVLLMPTLLEKTSGLRLALTAQKIAETLRDARSYAELHDTRVALKFYTQDDPMTYALYRDGDDDGVRPTDIVDGTDRMLWRRPLGYFAEDIRIGFPPGRAPRHPGDAQRRMNRSDDPIRFERSNLIAFSPRGALTPGAVYLSDGRFQLAAVRLKKTTGQITVLIYDQEKDAWRH
jgi:hypothetical protein